MKSIFKIVLFCLAVLSLSAQEISPEQKQQIDQMVQEFAHKQAGGGVAVAIITPDRTSSTGYRRDVFTHGHQRGPQSAPPNENAIFYLASVTKVLTSSVLAKFVRDGKVKLDDPAQKYMPEGVRVPSFRGREITLRDLATHTSALPRSNGRVKHPYHYEDKEFFQWLSHYKLKYAPGTKNVYSNVGYGFLGLILARIAHMSYEEVVIKEICEPLNMSTTRRHYSEEQKQNFCDFYDKKGKRIRGGCCVALPALGGGGAFASTLNDMSRFLAFNMGLLKTGMENLLPLLQQHDFTMSPNNFIGLGWYDIPLEKGPPMIMKISKNGGMPGTSTYIAFVKQSKTGVVVLANSDSQPTEKLGNDILKILNRSN
jgi:D-alanyl-D-alanine-carboxypeptidase/D-alanyl-D-alanine-endopeptidase